MDLDLRLAAFANLVPVKTEEVEVRLLAELNRIEKVLQSGTDYDELTAGLKVLAVLAPRFHARVIPMLQEFVRSVPARVLTQGDEPIPRQWQKYRSSSHLIRDAIDVPHSVRFVHTENLMDFLLELSSSEDEEVRGKAERTLGALAEFDLNLFYGEQGIGATPQVRIVDYLSKLKDRLLIEHASVILKMLRNALSPSMTGHTWTYSAVNISRSSISAEGGLAEMRAAAIELLKRMYTIDDDVKYRKQVLNTLGAATRRERMSGDANTLAMFEKDAVDVLNFLRNQVSTEELQLVQVIEHDAYWNYYHAASPRIAQAALEVRDAVDKQAEYQIYKQLIGFEGIHGAWDDLKRAGSARDYSPDKRYQAAAQYVDEINPGNYSLWLERILKFSKTRSEDMATFPIYYEFLRSIGQRHSKLALELVRDHGEIMAPFLIALMRGLWSSDHEADAEVIAQQWIADHNHLADLAKSLDVDGRPRMDLLATVILESDRVGDTNAIVEAIGVAVRQYGGGNTEAKATFLQGLRAIAKRRDARWADSVWFNRDFQKLVEAMDASERTEVLDSMVPVTEVDYRAEEVLYAIGQHDPNALLGFLIARVREERARNGRDSEAGDEHRYEAIPYNLHTLNKLLSNMPEALLSVVRQEFTTETASMFRYYGGARLIKAVFPGFEVPLQEQLMTYVRKGEPADIEFVVAILSSYEGEAPVFPICQEIIKVVPERSSAWNEVAAVLESTGVVVGEYGFAQAFESKRDEIGAWTSDDNPKVRAFATWFTEHLDRMIARERQRADESLALRKHQHRVDESEP